MDDFTPYGRDFDEALENLKKVLIRCEQNQLSLSTEKCHMMMSEGVVLGHFIFANGIQVDPSKIKVIKNIPTPSTQKEVRSFLGHAGYYRRFIKKILQTGLSLVLSVNEGCIVCVEYSMPDIIR